MLKTKRKIKEVEIFPTEKPKIEVQKNFKPKILIFLVLPMMIFSSYVVWKNGKADISEKRKSKLQEDIKKLDKAEQYALLATENKNYICLSCKNIDSVFLLKGEVWKYGVTINGQKGRYSDNFLKNNCLEYVTQFEGNIQDCLVEEKQKIYYYPILPENLKRLKILNRPAGNPQDR